MSDLIYRPEDEVLTELEKFKSHVFTCTSKSWGSNPIMSISISKLLRFSVSFCEENWFTYAI